MYTEEKSFYFFLGSFSSRKIFITVSNNNLVRFPLKNIFCVSYLLTNIKYIFFCSAVFLCLWLRIKNFSFYWDIIIVISIIWWSKFTIALYILSNFFLIFYIYGWIQSMNHLSNIMYNSTHYYLKIIVSTKIAYINMCTLLLIKWWILHIMMRLILNIILNLNENTRTPFHWYEIWKSSNALTFLFSIYIYAYYFIYFILTTAYDLILGLCY